MTRTRAAAVPVPQAPGLIVLRDAERRHRLMVTGMDRDRRYEDGAAGRSRYLPRAVPKDRLRASSTIELGAR